MVNFSFTSCLRICSTHSLFPSRVEFNNIIWSKQLCIDWYSYQYNYTLYNTMRYHTFPNLFIILVFNVTKYLMFLYTEIQACFIVLNVCSVLPAYGIRIKIGLQYPLLIVQGNWVGRVLRSCDNNRCPLLQQVSHNIDCFAHVQRQM